MFPDKPTSGRVYLKNLVTHEEIGEHEIPDYANDFFTKIGSGIIEDTGFNVEDWTYTGLELPEQFRL